VRQVGGLSQLLVPLGLTTVLLTLFLPCCVPNASSRTWQIPLEISSIQAGIDSSTSGDTVLVASGIYNENLDFKGKAIAVVGRDPQHTILDGTSGNWSCVQFISGEPRSAVLTGFTKRGEQVLKVRQAKLRQVGAFTFGSQNPR
jgi:hypothetical protein